MIKRTSFTSLLFTLLWGALFSLNAQTIDSTKNPKWEYSIAYGISSQLDTRNTSKFRYQNFARYPKNIPFRPDNSGNDQFIDYGTEPLGNIIELGVNYRFNNYFTVGTRSGYLFRNMIVESFNIENINYKRFNQQFEAKFNLNGEFEDQFNLIIFTQGSLTSSIETITYNGKKNTPNIDRTATEAHRYKYFSHSLGIGLEWVEYFKNTWGYGICFKIGNDMLYRRSIEKTEYTLDGENLLPLLNKNQTMFIFKNEVPSNANTSINEPTYAPRDFLPHIYAQLTLRFIYLR